MGFFSDLFGANSKPLPSFEVVTWGRLLYNVEKWQKENLRNQWKDAKYSTKPVYKYPWTNNIEVELIAEKNNEFDSKAIQVVLDGIPIGYVPRPLNEERYRDFLKTEKAFATIRGGDRKYIDEEGDLVKKIDDPLVIIYFEEK